MGSQSINIVYIPRRYKNWYTDLSKQEREAAEIYMIDYIKKCNMVKIGHKEINVDKRKEEIYHDLTIYWDNLLNGSGMVNFGDCDIIGRKIESVNVLQHIVGRFSLITINIYGRVRYVLVNLNRACNTRLLNLVNLSLLK